MTKSTLTLTKSSEKVEIIEGGENTGLEIAAILAPAGPLGITTMGALPMSLIASGKITRRNFDNSLTLRPKTTIENVGSPQQAKTTALTHRAATTKHGARGYPPSTIRHRRAWLAVLVALIALAALFILGLPFS